MKQRISNWPQYNRALINRGSLDIYIPEDILPKWIHKGKKVRGRPKLYSDLAITAAAKIRIIYGLPYRALQGFLTSLIQRWQVPLPVPSYTQICRRVRKLKLPRSKLSKAKARVLVIDSSGVQIYGEGEWLRKMHRSGKRRRWLKIHVAVNPENGQVVLGEVTPANVGDCRVLPRLLRFAEAGLQEVKADGAYDTRGCYDSISRCGARAVIPPRQNAVYDQEGPRDRQSALALIAGLGGGTDGRKLWKKLSRYHERSHAESLFSRYKGQFGSRLRGRSLGSQRAEVCLQLQVLNQHASLGLPAYRLV